MKWRNWVNLNLREYHRKLDRLIDLHWFLQVPGWSSVVTWRWQQEQELDVPALKSRTGTGEFLMHYQRLVEHMRVTAASWADLIIPLDASHCAAVPTKLIDGSE